MSAALRNAAVPSEAELIDWLKEKPRTLGWDAWMAYDRVTANLSLLCDYSDRFSTHVLATPVTGAFTLVDNAHWEHLYDVCFGAPQLSFEGRVLGDSRARLTVRAFSGTQLTVEQSLGAEKRVIKLEAYGPLQGPRLVANVALGDDTGAATAARQVWLDLATGEDYALGFAGTRPAQLKVGTFFKERFSAALPIESRCCAINTLGDLGDGPLAPAVIRARAFPLPGAEAGDGAVLLFIAAKDSDVGSLPDSGSDWVYPIPAGRNATLLVNNFALMTKSLAQGVRHVIAGAEIQYDNPGDPDVVVNTLTITKGTMQPLRVELNVDPFAAVTYQVQPAVAGEPVGASVFNITRDDGGLRFYWKTSSMADPQAPQLQTQTPNGATALDYTWQIGQGYRFAKAADGNLTLDEGTSGSKTWVKPVYRQAGVLDALHYRHFPALSREVAEGLAGQARQRFQDVASAFAIDGVDQLRREGLQFPGNRTMHLESVQLPTDLVLFGNVAAGTDAFVLEPSQAVVKAGEKLQITTAPPQTGMAYAVELLAGDGSAGSISTSGSYAAPSAAEIDGTSVTVRVTASKGTQTHSVLVHVVVHSLQVNPLVFAAWSTAGKTRLSAGSLDGGTLDWSIDSDTEATLEEAPLEGDVLNDEGDWLYVPGAKVTDAFFSVDKVTARNPRTGESLVTSALVVEKKLTGMIRISEDGGVPANQVQLEFHGGEGPLLDAVWEVPIGGGSIDQNGRYSMDPSSPDPFAVITATLNIPGVARLGNYLILPLPLIDLNELKRVLA
jgi:hypothetical protein